MKTFFVNGKFVKENQAKIKINDLGLIRGYGIFDYLRTYNKIPFHLREHLARFFNSAKELNLKIPYSQYEFKKIIFELIKKNKNLKEMSFRVILTGGETLDGKTSKRPSFFIIVNSPHFYPKKFYQKGIKLITLNYFREFPETKSLNYAFAIANWGKVLQKNAQEILYVFKNKVYEASTSNFFIVKNKIVYTPKQNILQGITKKVVINLAQKNNIKVKEKEIYLNQVFNAKEAFITATDKEIMPVCQIDNKKIGSQIPGEITKKLMRIFKQYTKRCSKLETSNMKHEA